MKRYIIILVLLMAFYPFIGGQKGCMKGSGEIGIPGEEMGDQLMVDTAALGGEGDEKVPDADLGKELVCPDDAALGEEPVCDPENEDGTVNCYSADDVDKVSPVVCQYVAKAQEECPEPPVKRVPACVALMPDAKGGFVYDYARLNEAIEGMEGFGENFRTNLTAAVDPMGLVADVKNVDSVCIACDYRSKAALDDLKAQADAAGHPFATWPALMKVYGLCEEVLVIYSFKEGKENFMAETFADVPSAGGIYSFPLAIKGAQSGNNVLFGTDTFLNAGLYRANSPSATFISSNIEFYLPAGILFYTHKDLGALLKAPGIARILAMYTITMPSQAMAFSTQTQYMFTSIDVFDEEINLDAGIYDSSKEALAKGSTVFPLDKLEAVFTAAKEMFIKVVTPLGP
jgi:hypothetical protein